MKNLLDLFAKHGLEKIRLNAGIIQADISLGNADRDAAWEMYVEMLTRIVTRPLPDGTGDGKAVLKRAHTLSPISRETLRHCGRQTIQFSKAAMPVLNQAVRPFTVKRSAHEWSILQQGRPCRISLAVVCPCRRLAQSRRVAGSCSPLLCSDARPGEDGAGRNRPDRQCSST